MRSVLVLLLFLFGLPGLVGAAERSVHIVLSDTGGAYETVAEKFQRAYAGQGRVKVWAQSDLTPADLQVLSTPDTLLVPVGMKASHFVGDNLAGNASANVLALMVPKDAIAAIPWAKKAGKASFVYIDQPVKRSLELIQAALPLARRIGVLVSDEKQDALRLLRNEASGYGLNVIARQVLPDASGSYAISLGPQLRHLLDETDVLLLLPDLQVVNNASLQNLLRASYRQRVPVIGFSPGQVKAGALACAFSSPEQIGEEGGRMARAWAKSGMLPAPNSASDFSVQMNPNVARSLGIAVVNELEVQNKLGASTETEAND